VSVQKSSRTFGEPVLNLVLCGIFFESIEVPVVLEEGFGILDVLLEQLADSSYALEVR